MIMIVIVIVIVIMIVIIAPVPAGTRWGGRRRPPGGAARWGRTRARWTSVDSEYRYQCRYYIHMHLLYT